MGKEFDQRCHCLKDGSLSVKTFTDMQQGTRRAGAGDIGRDIAITQLATAGTEERLRALLLKSGVRTPQNLAGSRNCWAGLGLEGGHGRNTAGQY